MSKPLCFTASRSVEWQAGFALYTGDPRPYMRPSLPHVDVQEPQGSPCRLTYFWGSLALHQHHSAHGLIQALSPVEPVTLVRPHAARRAARFFIERFPGTTLYAVKANPSPRSEEHTSELQSLMRNSYAVFCLKKKKKYDINRSHR